MKALIFTVPSVYIRTFYTNIPLCSNTVALLRFYPPLERGLFTQCEVEESPYADMSFCCGSRGEGGFEMRRIDGYVFTWRTKTAKLPERLRELYAQ